MEDINFKKRIYNCLVLSWERKEDLSNISDLKDFIIELEKGALGF